MSLTRRSALAAIAGACAQADDRKRYDILIRNGTVFDGVSPRRFQADVAIRGGRIVAAGKSLSPRHAAHVIDAAGLAVAPGFIDNHAHLVTLESHPYAENFLRQGITTIMGTEHSQDEPWPLAACRARVKMAPNVGLFAGHTWIRKQVLGLADRAPSSAELDQMRSLVRQSMQEGALGLSSGLEYVPATYSKTEEVIELARIAAESGGIYSTHLRDEGPGLLDAVEEALRIGREAKLPVLINHLKATGAAQFGWPAKALERIEAANRRGQRVAADLYPYTAFSTYAEVMFPAWALADGPAAFAKRAGDPETRARLAREMERIFPQQAGSDPSSIQLPGGRTLAQYLNERGRPPSIPEAVQALIELQLQGGFIGIFHAMSEDDVRFIMRHPLTMFDTDGDLVEPGSGSPHPRSYGAFPRVLAKYVREQKLIPLEVAIRKMTSLPAQWWRLHDRGTLKPGQKADVVVFDPETIQDRATYTDPHHYSEGIRHLLVNGIPVISNGTLTGEKPGEFLERQPAG